MYETDYNSGYGSVPASAYSQRHLDRDEIKKTIEDSRSSHYSLGNGQHKGTRFLYMNICIYFEVYICIYIYTVITH
jgi:hypothetical protein